MSDGPPLISAGLPIPLTAKSQLCQGSTFEGVDIELERKNDAFRQGGTKIAPFYNHLALGDQLPPTTEVTKEAASPASG